MEHTRKEALEAVSKSLYEKYVEEEGRTVYPKESIWPAFKKEIQEHGYVCEIDNTAEYICNNNPEEFRDIILKYYKKCVIPKEKSFLISCLINKKNKELTPFVLNEFVKNHKMEKCLFNDMVMNFIWRTADIKYKDYYIKVLKNKYIGNDLKYVLSEIGRLRIPEIKELMLKYYNDDVMVNTYDLRHYILKVLSYYKDPNLRYIFEENLNDECIYTRKLCERAIKNIEKEQAKQLEKK